MDEEGGGEDGKGQGGTVGGSLEGPYPLEEGPYPPGVKKSGATHKLLFL